MKETLGQRPPTPLSAIQASVSFTNQEVSPVQIPALLGQDLSDSGDREIPYVTITDSELSLLGQAQENLFQIYTESAEPGYVYPNEVQGIDGEVFQGALVSSQDFLPGTSPGVEDVREFDFLFVETGQDIPPAIQGILSVGNVTNNSISVPRFVSPT